MRKLLTYCLILGIVFINTSCGIIHSFTGSKEAKSIAEENKQLKFTYAFFEGIKSKMLGNYKDATEYLKKCIQLNNKTATARYELATVKILQGDIPEAMELMEEAVKIKPDNIWYQITLAAIYENLYQPDKSLHIYKNLAEKYPENLSILLNYADLLKINGKIKETILVLDKIENITGITEELSLNKQKLYFLIGEKEKGYSELKKLIDNFPLNAKYYGLLAELYVSEKEYDKAKTIYEQLFKIDPNSGIGHLSYSEFFRITGDSTNSFNELILAFESKDVSLDIKIKILLNHYFKPNNDKAYTLLDILEKIHPDDAKTYTVYGDFLYNDKKYKEAREKYKLAVEITKDNYALWEQLLHVESLLNFTNSMYKTSKEALEYFPNQPALYLYFGTTAIKKEKYNEAIEALLTGMGLVTDKNILFRFYSSLGEAYNHIKDYEKSDEYFLKAIEIHPDDAYVLNNYAYYLALRNENLGKAAEYAEKCNEIEPDNSSFLDTYAYVLFKQQKYKEALTIIEKAVDIDKGKNAIIVEHYGDILFKLGQHDKAVEYWKKALQAGKGSEFLQEKAEKGEFVE